ncbi:uncharacterized protein BN702_01331 [Bacteroides sp. CAG:545]|nr:uncharacterized protein BN702_01331 [Bacteroides sp. CAG:545]
MKTKLFLALAAFAAITISGCSKSETLQTPEIKVNNLSTTSFSFTWTAIPDATGYTYEVKAANQSTVTDGNREKPENVEVTGLSTASTYTVSVKALGTGSFTDSEYATITVTTLDNTIHFADKVLERRLLEMKEPKIDADGDGKITFEEAAAVKELQLGFDLKPESTVDCVTDITGLGYFTSLETLSLKFNSVSDIKPIEGISTLKVLILGENPISSINLDKLGELTDLRLYGTNISDIDLTKTPKLESLYLQRTNVSKVDLTPLQSLDQALLNKCSSLTEIKASNLPSITRIDAVECNLKSFEISDCPSLRELHLNSNKLTSIKMTNLAMLMRLNVYDNQLTSIDVSNLPLLMWLFVFDNQITSIDLSANVPLREFRASNNPLAEVNLSTNENIVSLELENMSKMKTLNIKNDFYDEYSEYLIVDGNTALEKVITDPGKEFEHVKKLFANNPKVQVVTE